VVQKEWEKLILEEKLQDVMESINCTSVMCSKYYIMSYGKKLDFTTNPLISKKPLKAKPIFIIERQQKFHWQLSKALW
jgi:hypothetical protein